jgi:Fe-S-cluster containining protein
MLRELVRSGERGESEASNIISIIDHFERCEDPRTCAPPGTLPFRHAHFVCRHFTVDRKCGAYEQRPAMCSAFPYGRSCPYCTAGEVDGPPTRWARVEETGVFTPIEVARLCPE